MNASDSALSIYDHMQAAVDIVGQSPHSSNKIAATIAGPGFAHSQTNHWPKIIADTIGTQTQIGNSSGTIHAETACIFAASAAGHATRGASIFITDPPCPNCVKNMAEAGIQKLYIDHKGFDKDWAKRRADSFETMSMRIAAKAGLDVYVLYRKEQKFEVISQHMPGYKPAIENPAIIEPITETIEALIQRAHKEYEDEPFALVLASDTSGQKVSICVTRHPTIGYTSEDIDGKIGKYSFILEPLNRILMITAREGLSLVPEHTYSNRTPTSRELINYVGAGFKTLSIGDESQSRDDQGIVALNLLKKSKILNTI